MGQFPDACADVGDDALGFDYEASRWVRAVRYREFVKSQFTQLRPPVSIYFTFHDISNADIRYIADVISWPRSSLQPKKPNLNYTMGSVFLPPVTSPPSASALLSIRPV